MGNPEKSNEFTETKLREFPEMATARDAFASGKTLSMEFRRAQLKSLLNFLNDAGNRTKIFDALFKDLRKHTREGVLGDIAPVKMEISNMLRNLDKYMATKHLPRKWYCPGDSACIRYEPHGVVLILGTWNYPFNMTLLPLVGAIAAGNCVIIKPSEISQHSATLMLEHLPQYLDSKCYHVVLGDAEVTKSLVRCNFDHIFFVGSQNMGKSILRAAADNLTPVTLELGGKSPVYIDDSACTKVAVKRIIWGKNANLGQTCIAPDYVICSENAQQAFVAFAKEVFAEWHGSSKGWQKDPGFSRIINVNHFRRLKNLLEKTQGDILFGGGGSDENDLWIEPTIVGNVKRGDILMEEEIFGPILPIVPVNSVDEAIRFINSMERPLALYIFSANKDTTKKVTDLTSSGGVCVNDVVVQLYDSRLPFGGKGNSGMGHFHGKYFFKTFSHQRPVTTRGLSFYSEKEMMMMSLYNWDITLSTGRAHFLVGLLLGYFLHTMFTLMYPNI